MPKKKQLKNPYAAKDGSPLNGKEKEFFNWEITRAKKELKKLSPEQQKERLTSHKALNRRMNS